MGSRIWRTRPIDIGSQYPHPHHAKKPTTVSTGPRKRVHDQIPYPKKSAARFRSLGPSPEISSLLALDTRRVYVHYIDESTRFDQPSENAQSLPYHFGHQPKTTVTRETNVKALACRKSRHQPFIPLRDHLRASKSEPAVDCLTCERAWRRHSDPTPAIRSPISILVGDRTKRQPDVYIWFSELVPSFSSGAMDNQ